MATATVVSEQDLKALGQKFAEAIGVVLTGVDRIDGTIELGFAGFGRQKVEYSVYTLGILRIIRCDLKKLPRE